MSPLLPFQILKMEKIEDIKTDDDSSHHVPLLQTSKYSQDGDDDDRSDSEKSSRDLTDPSRYSLKDYRQLQQRSCILAITNSISLVFAGICLLLLLLGAKHDSGRKDVTPILLSCMLYLSGYVKMHQEDKY